MQLEDILPQLTAWFEPAEHKERALPGGGRWFFVPHQTITDRLNKVCPSHWSSKVSSITGVGDYTVILLELTICGVTRTGVGDNRTIPEMNAQGKSKEIGNPGVRAFRNAFKDAAEQFGICAYLDEQKEGRSKQEFVRYMQGKGDARAAKFSMENGWNSEPTPITNEPVGRERLIKETTQEMKRLGWDEQQGRDYLRQAFEGKDTRQKLTNNELSRFLGYLKSQVPTASRPAVVPQPAIAPIGVTKSDPNTEWLKRITNALGYNKFHSDGSVAKALKQEFPDGDRTVADLDVFERNRIAGRILINYGEKSNPKAESLYQDAIASNEATGQLEPEQLAQAWLVVLSGQTAQVAS